MEVTRDAKVSTLEVTQGLYSKKGVINVNAGDFTLEENRSGSVLMVSGTPGTITMPTFASVGTNYTFLFNDTHTPLRLDFGTEKLQGTIYNVSGGLSGTFGQSETVIRSTAIGTKLDVLGDSSGKYTELECLKVAYDKTTDTTNEWFIRGQTDNLKRIKFRT